MTSAGLGPSLREAAENLPGWVGGGEGKPRAQGRSLGPAPGGSEAGLVLGLHCPRAPWDKGQKDGGGQMCRGLVLLGSWPGLCQSPISRMSLCQGFLPCLRVSSLPQLCALSSLITPGTTMLAQPGFLPLDPPPPSAPDPHTNPLGCLEPLPPPPPPAGCPLTFTMPRWAPGWWRLLRCRGT